MKSNRADIKLQSRKINEVKKYNDKEIVKIGKQIKFTTFISIALIVIGIIIACYGTYWYSVNKIDSLNSLGDFLSGTVGSIWALAGIILIYIAFLGQKQQLLNQRIEIMNNHLELSYTRIQLEAQRDEMESQNNILRIQKFENTFFQLLKLLSSIVDSLEYSGYKGRSCYRELYKTLQSTLHQVKGSKEKVHDIKLRNAINGFDSFYKENYHLLNNYFETFYNILDFIDKANIEDTSRYTAICISQLNSYELILIFYKCLHEENTQKLKPLIEKHMVLGAIDESLIINPSFLDEFNNNAFNR